MKKKSASGYIYIALATLIFSTMEVFLKMPAVSGKFDPMQMTVERFIIGGVCLIPFAAAALKKRGVRLSGSDIGRFLLTGLLCVPVSMVLYQLAISFGRAGVVAVVFSGNPIFVTLLAFLILREAVHWNNVLALVLEICGIVAIINPFSGGGDLSLTSITLAIISALIFALYTVMNKRTTMKCGGIVSTCGSFIFGGLEMLLLLLLGYTSFGQGLYGSLGLSVFNDVPLFSGFSWANLPFFLIICLINTAAGYVCYMTAMEKTSAATASLTFFFKPVIATVFAFLVLQEAVTVQMMIGIAFFLAGSMANLLPRLLGERKAKKDPSSLRSSE